MNASRVGRIVSIQVGLPQVIDAMTEEGSRLQPWTSGILKRSVTGPVRVGHLNIDGDGQADLEHHGGPDKAVLAYSADHYGLWKVELARSALDLDTFGHGGFGENLTVQDLTERDVCIGDIWRADAVRFQVSQPRQPCWKLGRRWRMPDLPQRVIRTGRSGWYLRVMHEGTIEPDMQLVLEARPHPEWTVARVASLRYGKHIDSIEARALAYMDELSGTWRADFARRI